MAIIGPKELRRVRGERNLLEDIPEAQRAAIAARTSTYDSAGVFTGALASVGVGGTLVLPGGRYRVASAVALLDGQQIVGGGGAGGVTEIEVPAGSTFSVLDIDGKAGVGIRGIKFIKASGAALSGSAYAIYIRGAGADVAIEDVWASGYVRGVCVQGQNGSTPGTVRRVVCTNVTCNDSTTSGFGFNFEEVDDVTLAHCYARGNGLDGVKLLRKVRKFRAIGGAFTGNGVGAAVADGIDTFAGGELVSILGGDYSSNTANGITVKTDTLNETDAATYGVPRDISIVGVTACNNTGTGVSAYAYESPSFATTGTPHLAHSVIANCLCADNGNWGIVAGGRNQSIIGNVSRGNGIDGIYVTERASRVDLLANHVSGNSRGSGGYAEKTRHGIYVAAGANHVTIAGGSVVGVDDRDANTEADLAALTKYHKANVYIHPDATNVLVECSVKQAHSIDACGIQLWGLAGTNQVAHQAGPLRPVVANGAVGVFGGLGSTWLQTDSTNGGILWIKADEGGAVSPTTGWQRLLVGTLGSASIASPGLIAAGATYAIAIAITGVVAGDVPSVAVPAALEADLAVERAWCTSGTVNATVRNNSGGGVTPATRTWTAATVRA